MHSALCLFVKNEVRDLAEWLVHHHSIGFERIIVYDNMSDDGTTALIATLAKELPVEHIMWTDDQQPVHGLTKQGAAYSNCIGRYRNAVEWLCFLDSDEFLLPPDTDHTIADLTRQAARSDAFAINWVIFGSGGVEDSSGRLVMEAFDRRSGIDFNPNRHVKMFFRPGAARRVLNPHFVETEKPCRDLDGDIIGWSEPGIVEPSNVVFGGWRLHHYFVRSRAHWRRRMLRRQPGGGCRDWEMFRGYDRNDVIDTRAIPFARRTVERLRQLGFDAAPVPTIDTAGPSGSSSEPLRETPKRLGRSPIVCVVDAVDDGGLRGWAMHPDHPDRVVTLRIEIDDDIYGVILCNVVRKDLRAAGINAERVGFNYSLPVDLPPANGHRFRLLDMNNKLVRMSVSGAWVDRHVFGVNDLMVQGHVDDPHSH